MGDEGAGRVSPEVHGHLIDFVRPVPQKEVGHGATTISVDIGEELASVLV
jgi:hypothetical protein